MIRGTRRQLPMIVAAEASECGLACLAMIARHHGHRIDLNSLRQRFSISLGGLNLRGLMGLAGRLHLAGRAVRIEPDDLPRLATPAILHWDQDHFVVFAGMERGSLLIFDPSNGAKRLRPTEVSAHFTGVALELSPTSEFSALDDLQPLRLTDLWTRATGLGRSMGQVLILSAALQILAFIAPFQIQLAVDQGMSRGDISFLSAVAVGFAAIVGFQVMVQVLRDWALLLIGQSLTYQMLANVVHHLLRLPADYFEKRYVGDILSRVGSARTIQEIITRGAVAALLDGVLALVAGVLMMFYSAPLALVIYAGAGANALFSFAIFGALRRSQEEQVGAAAKEQSYLIETIRAATLFKVMGREADRESAWRSSYLAFMNGSIRVGAFQISRDALQVLLTGAVTVVVIYLGGRMVVAGDGLSLGMLFALLSFQRAFTDRATSFFAQVLQFRLLGLHLSRLADIVLTRADPEDGARLETVSGGIALRDVGFAYGEADPVILRDVSLDIRPGEFVAITGASGGGKSTLLKLMLGLRQPTRGQILLDGQVASQTLWRGWRERVGFVAQDDKLLAGTIAENIAFFDPEFDLGRVMEAAKLARIHEDIMRLTMRYSSMVGDMGSTLSGGQKQRVLLARALYRRPAVLVLDEGTANLDVATEEEIAKIIDHLPITRIVVAHRPALIARADRVLTLAGGRLRPEERAPSFQPAAEPA